MGFRCIASRFKRKHDVPKKRNFHSEGMEAALFDLGKMEYIILLCERMTIFKAKFFELFN